MTQRTVLAIVLTLSCCLTAFAQRKPAVPAGGDGKMPITGLAPAKITPNLCVLSYRISTASPECQAHFDQGLGYFYSYVWMEAARSFETALKHDPDCAIVWWALSRAQERWSKGDFNKSLLKADELKSKSSHREQQLILARMQEKGHAPGAGDQEARKKAAIATLDNLLALHEDDEEAWYYRAQMAAGGTVFGGQVAAVPFYQALLRINPLHPGANHELVHFYEKYQRPALGMPYADKYIESSPGLPHPFHMQAHLATRIGRWEKTADRSARAIELERAYHRNMNVKPREDHQYSHHLEILTVSLSHDGRFHEARAIKQEAVASGYTHRLPWFKLHLAERDWAEALKIADQYRKSDKMMASYLAALVYLKQGDVARARPEVEVVQQAYEKRKSDKQMEYRLWETQGLLMCQSGAAEAGLKLLLRAVERSKNDYSHHAWGNGAYYMEAWGLAALKADAFDQAEEGLLEALAHDPGSVRAALGMQVLCERQKRTQEAARYAELAQRCWRRADSQMLERELAAIRAEETLSVKPRQESTTQETPEP